MSGMPRGGAKEKRFRCSTKQKALEGEFHLLAFDQWHLQVLADAPPITKLACLGQEGFYTGMCGADSGSKGSADTAWHRAGSPPSPQKSPAVIKKEQSGDA